MLGRTGQLSDWLRHPPNSPSLLNLGQLKPGHASWSLVLSMQRLMTNNGLL